MICFHISIFILGFYAWIQWRLQQLHSTMGPSVLPLPPQSFSHQAPPVGVGGWQWTLVRATFLWSFTLNPLTISSTKQQQVQFEGTWSFRPRQNALLIVPPHQHDAYQVGSRLPLVTSTADGVRWTDLRGRGKAAGRKWGWERIMARITRHILSRCFLNSYNSPLKPYCSRFFANQETWSKEFQ